MSDEHNPGDAGEFESACRWISNMGGVVNEAGNDLHRLSGRLRGAASDGERRRLIAAKLAAIRRLADLVSDLHECLSAAVEDPMTVTQEIPK